MKFNTAQSLHRALSISALLVAATSSSMFASTVSYYTNIGFNAAPFSNLVLLQGFDPALGTLTGVSLSLPYSGNINAAVTNISQTTYTYSGVKASTDLNLTGPAGLSTTPQTKSTPPFSGNVGFGTAVLPSVPFSGTITASPNDLADYTTSGNVSLNFIAGPIQPVGSTDGPSNSVFFGGGATASGTLSVVYTFTPPPTVPEPTTMVLFASAVIGLGLLRKHARR